MDQPSSISTLPRPSPIVWYNLNHGTWTDVLGCGSPAAALMASFMLSMLSINRGNRLDSVEIMKAGEKIDSSERQQILRLSVCRRKEAGDVAQLVRALPCHGRGRGFEPRRPRH